VSRAPWPPAGRACRVAFVGPRAEFEACALGAPAGGLDPLFVDFREGGDPEALLASVEAFAPHVVIAFRPEILPAGLLAGVAAVTVGYATGSGLAELDAGAFDRLVTDAPAAGAAWRALPLPVDDAFFADVRPARFPPRVLFAGDSTEYRERLLVDAKHEHDLLHVVHGIHGERLHELFDRVDVAINVHSDDQPAFEHRVAMHLAAGHLVISEPLTPSHALEPGLDFVEISGPWALKEAIGAARNNPRAWHRIRVRGRAKAELFRASHVYPRLIADLRRDLETFGSDRRRRQLTRTLTVGEAPVA